jgi:tetratricopeptide (TPR) repeat protein
VVEHTPGRFAFHDLLRAFATELADAVDTEADRRAALRRVLDHYLYTARIADRLLYPHRDAIVPGPPSPGVTPESLAGTGQALAWFVTEHPVLLAAVEQSDASGFDTLTWQLAWVVAGFFQRRGHWHDQASTQRTALAAARRADDRLGQALAHRHLAQAYVQLSRYEDARTHYRHALDLYGELGVAIGQGHAHLGLSCVSEWQDRRREALHHAWQARDLFQAADDRPGHALALTVVGWRHAQLGHYDQALAYCLRALPLLQEIGDRYGIAVAWDSLGFAHHHLGHHRQAAACYEQALGLSRNIGDRYDEAATLTRLGDTCHAVGDVDAARHSWQQAVDIFDQLGHPDTDLVRAKLQQ